MQNNAIDERVAAQQKAFDILCSLESRGYDMSCYFGLVVDIVMYRNK